jgi:beta-phosphoglucomutase family hydrolase
MEDLHFAAATFDLDGVVTRTARIHAAAWKELFDALLERRSPGRFQPFDLPADYLRYIDGKPRYDGVRSFLAARGISLPDGDPADGPDRATVCGLGNRKNEIFLRLLEERGVEVSPGTVALVRALRARGARTAVATSSKNGRRVLARAGLLDLFDAVVDGEALAALGLPGKPAPDLFLEAARRLGVEPARGMVAEDALSGGRAGATSLKASLPSDQRSNWTSSVFPGFSGAWRVISALARARPRKTTTSS